MFERKISQKLQEWRYKSNRKPLVLRGARQVGKTTTVNMFGKQFQQYIYLNLEIPDDRNIFERERTISQIIDAIFFLKDKKKGKETLLFIDEIQNSPTAVAQLRYFYEQVPELFVIAAGSLLETLLDLSISFPVGRVEFLLMHPVSFEEFLMAMSKVQDLKMLQTIPSESYANKKLFSLFHQYAQIGGMPEAIENYQQNEDLTTLEPVYENLLISYMEDVEKYVKNRKSLPVMRHIMSSAFNDMAVRIKYAGFGKSSYGSREVKEALLLLEKAFLFQLVHPMTTTTLPLMPNLKKSPRLHILDTAFSIYALKMHKELFNAEDMNELFSGRVIEHLVGQELYALHSSPNYKLNFWVREKNQSNAEVDYVIQYKGKVVPLEVKSGSSGRLRSLHQFMDTVSHDVAVRFCRCSYSVEETRTIAGKAFKLINVPYFAVSQIEKILDYYL